MQYFIEYYDMCTCMSYVPGSHTLSHSLTILCSFFAFLAASLACSKLRDLSAALHIERLCNTCHKR